MYILKFFVVTSLWKILSVLKNIESEPPCRDDSPQGMWKNWFITNRTKNQNP